ncbi:MAG: hypothetical protein ACOX88_02305 [Christensenellales bacterium]|jgi:hypothetical protein
MRLKRLAVIAVVLALCLSTVSCLFAPFRDFASDAPAGTPSVGTAPAKPTPVATSAPTAAPTADATPAGTRKNPLPIGETGLWDGIAGGSLFFSYKVELTLLEVIRGEEALEMAKKANRFNDDPPDGMEYIFAKFKATALASRDDELVDINSVLFDLFTEGGGVKYNDFVSVAGLEPRFTDMYAPAEQEGFAYFYVNKDDEYPLICFMDDLWFTTDPDYKLEGGSGYTPSEKPAASENAGDSAPGTRRNPVALGQTGEFKGMDANSLFHHFDAKLTITEVIRGEKALDMAKKGNRFNDDPPDGMEYLFAKFSVEAIDSKDDEAIDINNAMFDIVSTDGVHYNDFVSVAGLSPRLDTMYAPAKQEGYAYFYVNKDDKSPTIVFLDYIGGGLWFATTD